MNISEISEGLTAALVESTAVSKKIEKLKADHNEKIDKLTADLSAALGPLETQQSEVANKVSSLMRQYADATGTEAPSGRGRRKGAGTRKPQKKREPIFNIDIQMRKAYTTAVKGGATDKDAKKTAVEAGKKAAEKSGYTGALPTPTYK